MNTVRGNCAVSRTVLMLAAASSGIGERQGGVKEAKTRMGARVGALRQPGQLARTLQRRSHRAERAFGMPAPSDECGHRVDHDIRPPMH